MVSLSKEAAFAIISMICLSLSHKTVDGLLGLVTSFATSADILEIRLDLLSNPEGIDFEQILSLSPVPLIFTNRKMDEGGGFRGDERERTMLLENAVEAGADFIDIEFRTSRDIRRQVMEKAHIHETKVIVSFHDFQATPGSEDIKRLFDNMAETGADVIKIVTMASDPHDFIKLMPVFTRSRQASVPVIAFCMGEQGRFSRIFSLSLGGFLTFASIDQSSQTAPGQVPLDTMKQIIALLKQGQEA